MHLYFYILMSIVDMSLSTAKVSSEIGIIFYN